MRLRDRIAAAKFGENCRDGTQIVEHLASGAMKVLLHPFRRKDYDWHTPSVHVPELQWHPATGITRWEFERQQTPPHQVPLFSELRGRYQQTPPQWPSEEVMATVMAARDSTKILPNGLPGDDLGEEVWKEMDRLMIKAVSPDAQWRFLVQCVQIGAGQLADRLDVRHCDFRTVADWHLLCRFRAWVLPDDREFFFLLPGQDPSRAGWKERYENATPNNLAGLSPRYEDGGEA